ncbi:hypothetical protein CC80DRAFT_127859 [Byssothecium circinans]|uniref:Telomeric single stranded DNA binding POT1/Cdc13 domain-containing protein n=1 Tax=Byssothecium circinans TaxID=147558 RepID=A0A6A5TN02_9PLEO|nr:hypothetical protein CC80DRAFT_127859 [Byssothecium circinans]
MSHIPIAELTPELPDLDSKQFRAVVTLIWPWSSSVRQFALLLAEPEFRLRRRNGQVRARFSGSSARALASTGVGIGDEVVLSLRGASFMREGTVSTPGKSIDYELEYTQTVRVEIRRNGIELANLDLADVTPTPAIRSPVRQAAYKPVLAAIEEPEKWSSPAFLKRRRLSEGPVFEAGYDPFTDDTEDGHARKRWRKSYKDWNAWTYVVRTPSPEKDADTDDYDVLEGSPSRPTQLPVTPVSPQKLQPVSVAGFPLEKHNGNSSEGVDIEEPDATSMEHGGKYDSCDEVEPSKIQAKETFVRDDDYYDLYAGPDEFPPSMIQYDVEGDTEPNTEEDESVRAPYSSQLSVTEVASEEEEAVIEPSLDNIEVVSDDDVSEKGEDSAQERSSNIVELNSINEDKASRREDMPASFEEYTGEMEPPSDFDNAIYEQAQRARERSGTHEDPITLDDDDYEPPVDMAPPPSLPLLQTHFQTTLSPGLLTPVGKEPQSPNLKPLDSSTLPMPSPFPGERDGITSYLEYTSSDQPHESVQTQQPQQPEQEADHVIESSFYSSVNSTHAPVFHESAFTDLRFTFGLDGSIFSRPAEPPKSNEAEDGVERQPRRAVVEDDVDASQHHDYFTEVVDAMDLEGNFSFEHDQDLPTTLPELPNESVAAEEREKAEVIVLSSSSAEENVTDYGQPAIDTGRKSDTADDIVHEAPPSEEKVGSSMQQYQSAVDHASTHDGVDDVDIGVTNDQPSFKEKQEVVVRAHVQAESQTEIAEMEEERTCLSSTRISHPSSMNELVEVDEQAPPIASTQISAAGTEIIDLGSSSGGESELEDLVADSGSTSPRVNDLDEEDMLDEVPYTDDRTEDGEAPAESQEEQVTHLHQDVSITTQSKANEEEQQVMGDALVGDVSYGSLPNKPERADAQPDGSMDDHPDIKMESIEEEGAQWVQAQDFPPPQEHEEEPANQDNEDVLIAIPKEGNKIGELQLKSVPSTAPARNTRSKTKASMSPAMDEQPTPSRTNRSKKGKESIARIVRTTLSPSVPSKTKDTTPISPYSLRSQSKLLSPVKDSTFESQFENPRQESLSHRSVAVQSDDDQPVPGDSFQSADLDLPDLSFNEPPKFDASQGRFSNVGYVKDSEEGSLPSENSLSTIQYSDDWNMDVHTYTNINDPVETDTQMRDGSTPVKPRPAAREPVPATPSRSSARAKSKTDPQVIIPAKQTTPKSPSSFPTQPTQGSPSKSRLSITPTKFASISPRRSQRLSGDVYDIPVGKDELSDVTTPKQASSASGVTYPRLPSVGEGDELRSSTPPPAQADEERDLREFIASSPPVEQPGFASVNQQSLMNSNMPMTPEATQQTFASQPSFSIVQQEQSMPMTPQLTQSTSANPRSFKAAESEEELIAKTSPARRSAPRRRAKATAADSQTNSPAAQPEADGSMTLVTQSEQLDQSDLPSIGLSTPIAYYTPLKDLPFFLNRSSQFHSSSNPDVIALVTTPTTTPKKAEKGPRHWNTTLHVTDLSSYPSTTTVQIFRPYATALPVAHKGDVILLRSFAVKSLNRHPMLISGEESACGRGAGGEGEEWGED